MQTSQELTPLIIAAIQEKKGRRITAIDLTGIESATAPEFVICEGRSSSQVAAIADGIRDSLAKEIHLKPYHYDGYRNSQWIILDYGSVMVHVFMPEFREFYDLEGLWCDGKTTRLPDED